MHPFYVANAPLILEIIMYLKCMGKNWWNILYEKKLCLYVLPYYFLILFNNFVYMILQ
jgi:hypothetical protein